MTQTKAALLQPPHSLFGSFRVHPIPHRRQTSTERDTSWQSVTYQRTGITPTNNIKQKLCCFLKQTYRQVSYLFPTEVFCSGLWKNSIKFYLKCYGMGMASILSQLLVSLTLLMT